MKVYLRKVSGHFGALLGQTRSGASMATLTMAAPGTSPLAFFLGFAAVLIVAALAALYTILPHQSAALPVIAFAGVTADVSKLVDEIKTKFEEFKTANDERLAQIEKKGSADAVLNQKVEQINAAISDTQAEIAKVRAALVEVENNAARFPQKAADITPAVLNRTKAFLAQQRNTAPHNVRDAEVTPEVVAKVEQYNAAFSRYLRVGPQALSADDIATLNGFRPQNAMQTNIDPQGGYLTSADRTGEIISLIYETSPIRSVADVKTTSKDRIEGGLDLDEVSGGLVGETAARTETNTPTVGEYAIVMGEYYAQPGLFQKQIDDPDVDLEAWLSEKTGNKIGRMEASDFVSGAGILGPRGFLTYATGTNSKTSWQKIQQLPTGQSGAFASSNPGDVLVDTVASIKTALRSPDSAWLMRRLTVAAVRKLKDGQGNYLWQPDFTKYAGGSLLGYAVVEAEDMPAIAANSLSIAFGNWKAGYRVYDHTVGMRTLRDPFTVKGKVLYYTTKRTGGDVANFDAIKLVRFGT